MPGKKIPPGFCRQCSRSRRHHTPSDRLQLAYTAYLLQEAGFPFRRDDFTLSQWKLIAEYRMARMELEQGAAHS